VGEVGKRRVYRKGAEVAKGRRAGVDGDLKTGEPPIDKGDKVGELGEWGPF
jgi:hypothetical protein